ncbi:hypothetical protein BGX34_004067 [Mortierella sp. NVP85]|nr:hypothetical protein BGX34_004067 [Mortierella sp. NVP85]
MQFKTLAVVAIAAAAVSAQTFENNPCSQCVLSSFKEDSTCKTLSADDMNKLSLGITPTKVEPALLAAAIQKPEVRACVCHWATTAFTTGGAASTCISGAAPTCNSTQQDQAAAGIKGLGPLLNCNANGGGGATPSGGSGATPSGGAGGSASPSPSAPAGGKSGASSNIPNVILAAVVGLAAFVGF